MSTTVPTPSTLCGMRRPGWDQGPAIGRHRIPCVLESQHEGDHRDALGQAWPGYRQLAEAVADRIVADMPALADRFDRVEFVNLVADGFRDATRPQVACPDGRPWCTGEVRDHTHPDEHLHHGPEHSMNGSYGLGIMPMHLVQINDEEVRLAFEGRGDWPDLGTDEVTGLIDDMAAYLERLRSLRSQMAALQGVRDYADTEDHRNDANVRTLTDKAAIQ